MFGSWGVVVGSLVGEADGALLARLPEERRAHILHQRMLRRIRDKENNMRNRLVRRRTAIWAKWWSRIGMGVALSVAIPLAVALVALVWSFALRFMLG